MLRCVNEIEEYEYKKKDIEQENVESQKSIADFEENIKVNEENIEISKKMIIELEESFKVISKEIKDEIPDEKELLISYINLIEKPIKDNRMDWLEGIIIDFKNGLSQMLYSTSDNPIFMSSIQFPN